MLKKNIVSGYKEGIIAGVDGNETDGVGKEGPLQSVVGANTLLPRKTRLFGEITG